MKEAAEFAKVDLSTMQVQQKPDNLYDVYSDEENSVVVQADTAYEAIKKSGIVSPYKVEHKLKFTELILADSDIILKTNGNTDLFLSGEGAQRTEEYVSTPVHDKNKDSISIREEYIMPTNKEQSQDEPRENQNNENIQHT
jgi:hypothetical protein